MAIENTVSSDFYPLSPNVKRVFDCRLSGVITIADVFSIGGKRSARNKRQRGSKIVRNSVFDCHLSPVGQQMAIENAVSSDF